MIYISKQCTKSTPCATAFKQRGLNTLTQAKISDVVIAGKATEPQFAYGGYKNNIEAFLFATATQQRVMTMNDQYPIPHTYLPTIPLGLPQTIVRFKEKPDAAMIVKIESKFENRGFEKVVLGKGEPTYTIKRPEFNDFTIFHAVCSTKAAHVDSHAQLDSALLSLRLYQCVDLFLRTNTYEYKSGETFDRTTRASGRGVHERYEARSAGSFYRQGYNKDSEPHKRLRGDPGVARIRIDDMEVEDLTPGYDTVASGQNLVFVAKPSPIPASKTCWGSPSEVPFKSGMLFPYFEGMLVPDAAGLRELVVNHFFRCLGDKDTSAHDAYKKLRTEIGTFANTPQGICMAHILKGISLALDTQTMLYLLFDNEKYLGFTLMGECFRVFFNGAWHLPSEAELLRTELATLSTHDQTLVQLVERLKLCVGKDGDALQIDDEDLPTTTSDVLDLLSLVDVTNNGGQDEKDLGAIIARLHFPLDFLSFRPANVAQSIRYLFGIDKLPEGVNSFIPLKDWSLCGTREFKVFAMYGPRSFSFRNVKGDEIRIPQDLTESNAFDAKLPEGQYKYAKYIVGEKPVNTCILEWRTFVTSGKMRMDFAERAAASRNHVYPRSQFECIWKELLNAGVGGFLKVERDEKEVAAVGPSGSKFGEGKLADYF